NTEHSAPARRLIIEVQPSTFNPKTLNHRGYSTEHSLPRHERKLREPGSSDIAGRGAGLSAGPPAGGAQPPDRYRNQEIVRSHPSFGIGLRFRFQYHQPTGAGSVLGARSGGEFPQRKWLLAGTDDGGRGHQCDAAPN